MGRRSWEWRNVGIAGRQLESSNMELYQANQLTDQARRVKSWLCEEVEIRNRTFQEDRARDCQYIEELRRICCAGADRARQMKYDELSTQQKENPSTVNQLLAQIQELQDKVNSLNNAKEFYHPETASSSGDPTHQDTFLKVCLLEVNHPQHSSRFQIIWHRRRAD